MGYGNWRRGFPGLFFKKKEGNVLLEPSAPLVYKIIMVMFLVLYFFYGDTDDRELTVGWVLYGHFLKSIISVPSFSVLTQ